MIFSAKKQNGFTLLETVVTIFIFSLIMGGTTLLMQKVFLSGKQQPLALDTIDQARIVASNFTNELRNAAYGSDGSYPLGQASSSQIIIYSSYGSTNNSQVNKIRYYISGMALLKGTTAPSGSPLIYNAASETTIAVITNINNVNVPVFYYYAGDYAGTSTPLSQPVNINSVKYIAMNLILPKQDSREATTTFTLTAGGTIRNLKTNLGN